MLEVAFITAAFIAAYTFTGYVLWKRLPPNTLYIVGGGAILIAGILLILEQAWDATGGGYILRAFLPSTILGLVWGAALIVAGYFFPQQTGKITGNGRKWGASPRDPSDFDAFLRSKEQEFFSQLESPIERGKADARANGGPFPKSNDKEPSPNGYEGNLRRTFKQAGTTYLQEFIKQLKASLEANLQWVSTMRDRIGSGHYVKESRNRYKTGIHKFSQQDILNAARRHKRAQDRMNEFEERCKLEPGETLDHGTRAGNLYIILVLLFLGFCEWGISIFLLDEAIGDDSLQISAYAVMIMTLLALGIAFVWRFTRRNQKIWMRQITGLGTAFIILLYGFALGLMMGYRGDATALTTNPISHAAAGYATIGGESGLTQFILLIFNITAFCVTVYHISLLFSKFPGYDPLNRELKKAQASWEKLEAAIRKNNRSAIEDVIKQCETVEDHLSHVRDQIKAQHLALGKINESAVTTYGNIFQMRFQKDVAAYRNANAIARMAEIYPVPGYFEQMQPIDFALESEQICAQELQGIPNHDDIHKATTDIQAIQDEIKNFRDEVASLENAYNKYDKETIAAATQNRDPEHDPHVLAAIGIGNSD